MYYHNILYIYWLGIRETYDLLNLKTQLLPKTKSRGPHFCLKAKQMICCPNPSQIVLLYPSLQKQILFQVTSHSCCTALGLFLFCWYRMHINKLWRSGLTINFYIRSVDWLTLILFDQLNLHLFFRLLFSDWELCRKIVKRV